SRSHSTDARGPKASYSRLELSQTGARLHWHLGAELLVGRRPDNWRHHVAIRCTLGDSCGEQLAPPCLRSLSRHACCVGARHFSTMPMGAAVRSSTLLMKRALRRLESPLVSKRWLVLEAIVCLAPTLLAALGCSVATLHWLVISIFFDAGVPLSTYVVPVYGLGPTVGMIAVGITLATRFGAMRRAGPFDWRALVSRPASWWRW